jgi:HAD superfamily hydrolase (TIGR01509 family)
VLKALLFDLDGTLAETDSLHFPAWAEILGPHGHQVDWDFYRERISGLVNPDIVAEFLPHLSEEEGRKIIESKEADFRSRLTDLEPLPGLKDFIARAESAGLRIALVTNAPKKNALAVIRAFALEETFGTVVLAEDVGAAKPAPAPYHAALDALSVTPDEALAFEDSTSGIASAVGAGIRTVGVASTQTPEKLRDAGAFEVVRDFADPELARITGL